MRKRSDNASILPDQNWLYDKKVDLKVLEVPVLRFFGGQGSFLSRIVILIFLPHRQISATDIIHIRL